MAETALAPAQTPAAGPASGPAATLIDLILDAHHGLARSLAAQVPGAAAAVAAEAGGRDPRLAAVAATCERLGREMLAHLAREEGVLFPLIRELEAQGGGDEGDCGLLFSPIVCMQREHRLIDGLFSELRELTDGFVAPGWASAAHRQLLSDLERFEQDTREHVHKENDQLFPLADDLVPAVS